MLEEIGKMSEQGFIFGILSLYILIILIYIILLKIDKKEKFYGKLIHEAKIKEKEPVIEKPTIGKLEEFLEIDKYLFIKLESLYDNFLFTRIVPMLNEFSSITVDNRKKLREEFIEKFDFLTTPEERIIFQKKYPEFETFKFIMVEYFNIKTTKLELYTINKFDIRNGEFRDELILKSLFDRVSNSEIKELSTILDTINK